MMSDLYDWEQEDVDTTLQNMEQKISELRDRLQRLQSDHERISQCSHKEREHMGGFILNEVRCRGCGFTWYN